VRFRNRYFLLADVVLLTLALLFAYAIRFEGWKWAPDQRQLGLIYLTAALPFKLFVFWAAGLYSRLWRYASVSDLEVILLGGLGASMGAFLLGALVLPFTGLMPHRISLPVLFIDAFLTVSFPALLRLAVRVLARRLQRPGLAHSARPALIAGAGAAGGLIAKELLENPQLGLAPVGFLDDDVAKHRHRLHGVPVLGSLADLVSVAAMTGAEEVIIAMPTAPGRIIRQLLRAAHEAGVATRTVPGLFELIGGRKSVNALRRVEIQDLLRREPIRTDLLQVRTLAAGRTVLITGAGGSIGSELCRQVATLDPACLVVLGRGENSIFELMQELRRDFPRLHVVPVIADVRDGVRVEAAFRRYRPFTVFHAAAHKHVPLMEHSVSEAVLNNVLGTQTVAALSASYGVQHFVLISTDKAVRPTSVMGATKRIAEVVVDRYAELTGRPFVSVRFGNVLGSRGSVVPIFLKQIEAGGPVTVTHPEMRRYFMTIPEAVQLVLQAGAMGRGGEVFVLDMGEPVRIADLAADLVRLSGLELGTDIEIQFTGERPGEKLYEELFFSSDCAVPTEHPKILRGTNEKLPADASLLIKELVAAAREDAPPEHLRRLIMHIVPEYVDGPTLVVAGDSAPAPEVPAATAAPHVPGRRRVGEVPAARSSKSGGQPGSVAVGI
jgi:FlaA1/EpsC-like NDP-sugar epimerase